MGRIIRTTNLSLKNFIAATFLGLKFKIFDQSKRDLYHIIQALLSRYLAHNEVSLEEKTVIINDLRLAKYINR